jgi:hypothetical protein
METQHLFVSWKSKPPLEGINVWHVDGDISYNDGKFVFKIANGSLVRIDPEQIVTIGITKTDEQMKEMVERAKRGVNGNE